MARKRFEKDSPFYKIGPILKSLRSSHELTQAELSEKLGVSEDTVREWEQQYKVPTADSLILLSNFYQVSIDYLLGRIEATTHDKTFICKELNLSEDIVDMLINPDLRFPSQTIDFLLNNVHFYEMIDRLDYQIFNKIYKNPDREYQIAYDKFKEEYKHIKDKKLYEIAIKRSIENEKKNTIDLMSLNLFYEIKSLVEDIEKTNFCEKYNIPSGTLQDRRFPWD